MSLIEHEPKIQEYHDEIHEFIKEIDKKVVEMVQGHEKDFLVAFRAIMSQVHSEMTKLREISDEQALLVKRNNAINDLKSALEWFQNEAVKLSEACSDIQEKYDLHKQRIHALETENSHLEKMVKVYTAENDLLKQEFFAVNEKSPENSPETLETASKIFKSENLEEIFQVFQVSDPLIAEEVLIFQKNKEEAAVKALDHKLFVKEKEMKKLQKIKAAKEKFDVFEGEYENLFNECAQKVIEQANLRRTRQTEAIFGDSKGFQGKFLLTAADKRKILEEFITHPQVYALLSQKLFPEDL
jgi:uncharacterized protein YukE